MPKQQTCYMCDMRATSREHAPPLCLFPDADVFGRDVRRNLITVPSCDLHNSKKSKDDEFFRAVILVQAAQSSEVARHQFFQKLLRAASRTPAVHRAFFTDRGTLANGTQHAMQIDRDRFDACVDHIARAMYFNAYRQQWPLPIGVISPNFFSGIASSQPVPHTPTLITAEVSRQFLGTSPIRGENPEVFKYRLRFDKAERCFAFAALFYDLFEVYCWSSPGMTVSEEPAGGNEPSLFP